MLTPLFAFSQIEERGTVVDDVENKKQTVSYSADTIIVADFLKVDTIIKAKEQVSAKDTLKSLDQSIKPIIADTDTIKVQAVVQPANLVEDEIVRDSCLLHNDAFISALAILTETEIVNTDKNLMNDNSSVVASVLSEQHNVEDTAKVAPKKWGQMFSFLTDTVDVSENDLLAKEKINNIDKWALGRRWAIGVQAGTDVGGAIPVPIENIPKTFNPYPRLNISLGARVSWSYNNTWSVHSEVTYKGVDMDADARVENQVFKLDGGTQYFSGTAQMNMSFKMIEVPLYVKVALSDKYNDFFIFGGYYSHILSSNFVTIAEKGYLGGKPDEYGGSITPDKPFIMDFSQYLDNWDAGIVLGYERRIWKRANLGIRMMVGFKDIFTPENAFFDYKMWNMRGSIFLEYDLFLIK